VGTARKASEKEKQGRSPSLKRLIMEEKESGKKRKPRLGDGNGLTQKVEKKKAGMNNSQS